MFWVGGGLLFGRDIDAASRYLPDPRVSHFWDDKRAVTHAYRRALAVNQDPWDVYLLYGPQAHWTGADPPAPDFWMQKVGFPQAPLFDGGTFAAHAGDMLGRTPD